MKKLSISQFEEYCTAAKFSKFIFDIECQPWYEPEICMKQIISYKIVHAFPFLSTVGFKNGPELEYTFFRRIKYILVEDELGSECIFTFVCKGGLTSGEDSLYTMIAIINS